MSFMVVKCIKLKKNIKNVRNRRTEEHYLLVLCLFSLVVEDSLMLIMSLSRVKLCIQLNFRDNYISHSSHVQHQLLQNIFVKILHLMLLMTHSFVWSLKKNVAIILLIFLICLFITGEQDLFSCLKNYTRRICRGQICLFASPVNLFYLHFSQSSHFFKYFSHLHFLANSLRK